MPENGLIKIIMICIFENGRGVNFATVVCNYVTFISIIGMNFRGPLSRMTKRMEGELEGIQLLTQLISKRVNNWAWTK
jgi:hypothetical protein